MTQSNLITCGICPNCGKLVKLTIYMTPEDMVVEEPSVHWLAEPCKPSIPDMERKYTINKEEVTCLLCKIKCRCAEKQNGS